MKISFTRRLRAGERLDEGTEVSNGELIGTVLHVDKTKDQFRGTMYVHHIRWTHKFVIGKIRPLKEPKESKCNYSFILY